MNVEAFYAALGTEREPLPVYGLRLEVPVESRTGRSTGPTRVTFETSHGPAVDVVRAAVDARRPLWVETTDAPSPMWGRLLPVSGLVEWWQADWNGDKERIRVRLSLTEEPSWV